MNSLEKKFPVACHRTLIVASVLALSQSFAYAEEQPCSKAAPGSQAGIQCEAAKDAKEAAKKNKMIGLAYTGVASVCSYACYLTTGVVTTLGAGEWESYCNNSALGATVVDVIATKDFMGAMAAGMAAMMAPGATNTYAIPMAEGQVGPPQAENVTQTGKKNIGMSCMTAAFTGVKAFMKMDAAKKEEEAANANFVNANNSTPTEGSPQVAGFTATNTAQGGAGASGSASGGAQLSGSGPENSTGDPNIGANPCAGASQGGYMAQTSCARSVDSRLGFTQSPGFLKALHEATGLNPDQFASKVANEGAANAIGGAMGNALGGGDASAKASALMAALQQRLMEGVDGTAYAGGGAGGRRGGGGDDDPMGKALSDMMANLMPKKPGEEGKGPGGTLAFGKNGKRYPANVAEDRKVSIFDRVTNRYQYVSQRFQPFPVVRK